MNNIEFLRKIIIKKRIDYINELKAKKIDVSLSSLSSLRTLLFNNFCPSVKIFKVTEINKKVRKINFFYQLKNFLYISKFSKINIFGDLSQDNLKKYNKIIVVWSKIGDFSLDGAYYNNYFHTSSKGKKNLWFLIHIGNTLPIKIKKNIIILHQKKTRLPLNLFMLINYFIKILIKKNFSAQKVYHELSFDSLVAYNVKDFFDKVLTYFHPKKVIFPYESQPFQNSLIESVKKNKKKINLIGYDHTSNPFPIYNIYNSNSPDLLYVHSDASKNFYSKYLKWPKKKIIKTPSLRIKKKKSIQFKNKIFLPYDFYSINQIVTNFETFLNTNKLNKIKTLNVKIHPARQNSKKHQLLRNKLNEIIKNSNNKFEKNAKNSLSIHIGNTSTVIEALESNVSVIHLVCDPIFDLFSSKFWPTIKVSEISTNVYKYSIKKLGKCLIFNKKSNSFNKIHK